MRGVLNFSVLTFPFLFLSALPQQGPSTGSIEGFVVHADTGDPIANAQVTLNQISDLAVPPPGTVVQIVETPLAGAPAAPIGAAGAILSVTTGADGRFMFKDLKPATYRVFAIASGFTRQEYGQRVFFGAGRQLFVVAGKSITDATIRMMATGTIRGRILDQNGQPATGVPVQLVRALYTLQGKTYQTAATASADDRGDYRIYGVTPGRYYLTAGTQMGPLAGLRGNASRFSPLYYPNASNIEQAALIEVKSGNESSFDMNLKRETQTFHVRGRLIDPTGAPFAPNITARLGYRTFSSAGNINSPGSFNPTTGTFDLPSVPPGDFFVVIAPTPGGGLAGGILAQQATQSTATAPIHVINADIDGVVLTLMPSTTVPGKLIVEGQPISAVPNLAQLRVNLRNVLFPFGLGMPTASAIAADGSFQVAGVRQDDYRVQLSANVPGFYLKSIKYGEEEILGKILKFSIGGSGSLEVVLRAGTGTVSGTVTDSKSQPVPGIGVVVVPIQQARVDLFRGANTDQNGKFTVANLAPGEYRAFSWEGIDNNAFYDPDFLKQYEALGKAITVAESSNSNIDVKLIRAQ